MRKDTRPRWKDFIRRYIVADFQQDRQHEFVGKLVKFGNRRDVWSFQQFDLPGFLRAGGASSSPFDNGGFSGSRILGTELRATEDR